MRFAIGGFNINDTGTNSEQEVIVPVMPSHVSNRENITKSFNSVLDRLNELSDNDNICKSSFVVVQVVDGSEPASFWRCGKALLEVCRTFSFAGWSVQFKRKRDKEEQ